MPNRMSAIDDVKLIQEIKKYPQIYDRRHNDYKNTQQRNELWDMIAEKTNCDSEFCQNRWVTLRVQFRREHKKLQSNPNVRKVWKHYDALKFLINHFREEANRKIVFTKENDIPLQLNLSEIHVQPTDQIMTESPVSFHPSEFLSSTPLTYINKNHNNNVGDSIHNTDINNNNHHHVQNHNNNNNNAQVNNQNDIFVTVPDNQAPCQQAMKHEPIVVHQRQTSTGDILGNVNYIKNRIDRMIHSTTFNRQMKLAAVSDLITHLSKQLQYVVEQ